MRRPSSISEYLSYVTRCTGAAADGPAIVTRPASVKARASRMRRIFMRAPSRVEGSVTRPPADQAGGRVPLSPNGECGHAQRVAEHEIHVVAPARLGQRGGGGRVLVDVAGGGDGRRGEQTARRRGQPGLDLSRPKRPAGCRG